MLGIFVLQVVEISRRHLGRQRNHHALCCPVGCKHLSAVGFAHPADFAEQIHLPADRRLDHVALFRLVGGQAHVRLGAVLGIETVSDRRSETRFRGLEREPGLLDARQGYGYVAVISEGGRDQPDERRVVEQFPPPEVRGRIGCLTDVALRNCDRRGLEPRAYRAAEQGCRGEEQRKVFRIFHDFSFFVFRFCSYRLMRPTSTNRAG